MRGLYDKVVSDRVKQTSNIDGLVDGRDSGARRRNRKDNESRTPFDVAHRLTRADFELSEYVIGIDNGVSGSVCVMEKESGKIVNLFKTPIFKCRNYQSSTIKHINRVDRKKLLEGINCEGTKPYFHSSKSFVALLENPYSNHFHQTSGGLASAFTALEATRITLEDFGIKYDYLPAKTWQIHFFKNMVGEKLQTEVQKELSFRYKVEGDFDSVFIAEYLRRVKFTKEPMEGRSPGRPRKIA